jgi:lipopolysaccharide/colanic/teichoic acid biosynthesis glycosyltransferase
MKRVIDLLVSGVGLMVLSPLLAALALWIKLDSPGPVFHRGLRVGQGETRFRMIKFRSMVENAHLIGGTSTPEDDPRITRAGTFLRKYKLDELPQLLNVLKGEMSLVGPRPQVPWAVDLYTPEEKTILSVKPGITDYASLRFRDEGEILRGSASPDQDYMEKIHPEKMRLSLEYARTHSTWMDCKILASTMAAVIFGAGERGAEPVRESDSKTFNKVAL